MYKLSQDPTTNVVLVQRLAVFWSTRLAKFITDRYFMSVNLRDHKSAIKPCFCEYLTLKE